MEFLSCFWQTSAGRFSTMYWSTHLFIHRWVKQNMTPKAADATEGYLIYTPPSSPLNFNKKYTTSMGCTGIENWFYEIFFHFYINGGTQVWKFNFVKMFFRLYINEGCKGMKFFSCKKFLNSLINDSTQENTRNCT